MLVRLVRDVLAAALLPATAKPDDRRVPDEAARDRPFESLELVALDLQREACYRVVVDIPGARLPATVSEIVDFAAVVLIVAGGLFVAVATSKVGAWFPIPGPAIFLIVAAVASDVFPGLSVCRSRQRPASAS